MEFFDAQKKIIRTWFILAGFIFIITSYRTLFADLRPVSSEIWNFLGIYVAPVFTILLASTFFKATFYSRKIDKLYFHLAFYTSVVYLLFIFVSVVVYPVVIRQRADMILNGGTKKDILIKALQDCGLILNFLLPILFGVLAYFFYKSEKNS